MSYDAFAFSIADNIARIALNRPERGNAMDPGFGAELKEIAAECGTNPQIRAILITATGRFFSVGGDLRALAADRERLPALMARATADLHMAVARLAGAGPPLIVAVHALAAGGAVSLAAAADFLLAAPDARFYAAFAGVGFSADTGATHFLPRRMGRGAAMRFLMLNETWSAGEAFEAGLVDRIVEAERLLDEAEALARRLASGPTLAYGELKRLLWDASPSLEAQLEREAQSMTRLSRSEDAWRAMQAVLSKETPLFAGR